jgi:hypothetical protein
MISDIFCDVEQSRALAIDPDVVLRSAIGVFDRLVVIGYDKDGKIEAFGSLNFSNEEIVFAIERFKHKIMAGDYGKLEDEG